MHLLVVSHAASVPINQQFYADVQAKTGWRISLLIPSNWISEYGPVTNSDWPAFKGEVIRRPVRKSGNIILHWYGCGSMKKLLRDVNPDVIYVNHEPYALATAQLYRANARSIRVPIGFYSCQNILKRYPLPFRWLESRVYRQSAFAFPITETVRRVHADKGYAGPATLLPLGYDPAVHFPRRDIEPIRAEFNAADGKLLIGFLGRIVPEKGLDTLVSALSKIRDLPWSCAVIGAGWYDEQFRKLVASAGLEGRIIRKGYVPHPQAPLYLSAFDVMVLPSETQPNWKEQFGRVIVESLACGTPVVGSDSGEIATLIGETGGGLTFRERDADDFADKLRQMFKPSLRQSLVDRGRPYVGEHYTNAALVQRFSDTISRVVAT